MNWQAAMSEWLLDSLLSTTVILTAGMAAAWCCRQPVYRIRIIQWTLAGCLLTPLAQRWGGLPEVALRTTPAMTTARVEEQEVLRRGGHAEGSDAGRDAGRGDADRPVPVSVVTIDEAGEREGGIVLTAAPPERETIVSAGTAGRVIPARESSTGPQPLVPAAVSALYLAGVGIFGTWFALGIRRLRRLMRRSSAARPELVRVFRQIAGRAGEQVRLRISDEVDSPVTWGILQPVILAPAWFGERPERDEVRWGLAHEWSHVRRRDALGLWLTAAVRLVCFYQPAFWWLRRQLILSQDYLADSFAAGGGDEESRAGYAEFLVSLARRRAAAAPTAALGIGDRPSNLSRRVRMLVGSPLPVAERGRSWVLGSIAAGALLLSGAASALRITAAAPQAAAPGGTAPAEQGTAAGTSPAEAAVTNAASPAARVDALGDPLPEGSLLRIGTTRLRQEQGLLGVTFTPDGKQLVSMGWSEFIRFWDVETGALVRQIRTGDTNETFGAAVSPDGSKLASVSNLGRVYLWDVSTGEALMNIRGHNGDRVHGVAFSPDGKTFATSGGDVDVILWDVENRTEQLRFAMDKEQGDANAVAFSTDGRFLAAGSGSGRIYIRDLAGRNIKIIKNAHGEKITSLGFTPEGELISGGSSRDQAGVTVSEIRVWDPITGERKREFQTDLPFMGECSLAVSRDGSVAVTAHASEVVLWDARTGRMMRELKAEPRSHFRLGGRTQGVAISPDGRLAAGICWDNKVLLWNVQTGQEVHAQPNTHKDSIISIRFSPDGRRIFTGGEEGAVRQWDASTGKSLGMVDSFSGWIRYLDLLPARNRLVIGSETFEPGRGFEGKINIEQLGYRDTFVVNTFHTPTRFLCGDVSGDGKLLAAGAGDIRAGDAKILLWALGKGEDIGELDGHPGRIWDLRFDGDPQTVWSVGVDRSVRRWDVRTLKETGRIDIPRDPIPGPAGAMRGYFGGMALLLPRTGRLFFGEMLSNYPHYNAGQYSVRDLSTGEVLWEVVESKWRPTVAAATRDEQILAVYQQPTRISAEQHRLILLSAADGRELKSFPLGDNRIRSLAFSPDDQRLAGGMELGDMVVWDVSDVVQGKK